MTLTTTHNWIAYTSGASQTVFPYTFLVTAAADLRVYVNRILITSGYTVSNVGLGSGGNVTFAVGLTGGDVVLLLRDTDDTQQIDLLEGDKLPADTVEGIFDKVYAALQDVKEAQARTFGLPVSRAGSAAVMPNFDDTGIWGKALIVNAAGTGLDVVTLTASPISSPITSLGDLIQGGVAGVPERLPIGPAGQVATVVAGKVAWVALPAVLNTLADLKGDLIVATANDTFARKPAAANGAMLTTDSSQGDGLLWTPVGAAGSLLRITAGMPGWLAPGAETQMLSIASGVPAWVTRARVLDTQNGSVATGANTTETDAFTYSLPAATLAALKDHVRILVWGITAANANAKRYRVYFGATMIYDSTASTQNNSPWYAECVVWRTGAATQDAIAYGCFHLNGVGTRNLFTQPTETLSGAITIKVTITNSSASAGDITGKGQMVSFVPAP